jgi:undecaprenyl-diphosphatase
MLMSPREDSKGPASGPNEPEAPRRSRVLRWSGAIELRALVAFAVLVTGAWGFAWLGHAAGAGGTESFDRRVLLALREAGDPSDPIGPVWFEELVRDYTSLGGSGVLALVTAFATGYLVLRDKRRAATLLVATIAGGALMGSVLKLGFDRARPDLVPHGTRVVTSSFPSGHSMLSAVVYLTIGALLARVESRRRMKAFLLTFAFVLTLVVGVSRVYLGVHWPTDVLGGWAAGALWALACWLLTRRLQQDGAVETSDGIPEPGS